MGLSNSSTFHTRVCERIENCQSHSGKEKTCANCKVNVEMFNEGDISCWDEWLERRESHTDMTSRILEDNYNARILCSGGVAKDLGIKTLSASAVVDYIPTHERRNAIETRVSAINMMRGAGLKEKLRSYQYLDEIDIGWDSNLPLVGVIARRAAVLVSINKVVIKQRAVAQSSYIPRPLANPSADVNINEICLTIISSLVRKIKFTDTASLFQPIAELTSKLVTDFAPLSLFSEWSPPCASPEELCPQIINEVSSIVASTSKNSSKTYEAKNILTSDIKSTWSSIQYPVKGSTVTITFQKPVPIISLLILWKKTHIPQNFSIGVIENPLFDEIVADEKYTEEYVEIRNVDLVKLTPESSTEIRVHLRKEYMVKSLRITMNGVHKINTESYFEICNLSLFRKKRNAVVFSAKTVFEEIISFMKISSQHSELREDAVKAIQTLAMSSGSLAAIIQYIIVLLDFPISNHQTLQKVEEMVDTFRTVEKQQKDLIKKKESSGISAVVNARFEAESASTGITVDQDGMRCKSTTSSNTACMLNIGLTEGQWAWEFLLEEDSNGNEMSCFGAAIRPLTDANYSGSTSLWMYRAYNGACYAKGVEVGNTGLSKFHPNDVVRISLDLDAKTISYKINDNDLGVIFKDVTGKIYPAVAFYGSARAAKLIKLERIGGTGTAVRFFPPEDDKKRKSFEGQMVSSKRNGAGRLTYSNSTSYWLGNWVNDIQHGIQTWKTSKDSKPVYYLFENDENIRIATTDDIKSFGWACSSCEFISAHSAVECHICKEPQPLPEVDSEAILAGLSLPVFQAGGKCYQQQNISVAVKLLLSLAKLSRVYMIDPSKTLSQSDNDLQLEMPYAIEVDVNTFSYLHELLLNFLPFVELGATDFTSPAMNGEATVFLKGALSILQLICANFNRLLVSCVNPVELGLKLSSDGLRLGTLGPLHATLEDILNGNYPQKLKREAAEVVDSGLPLLYPQAQEMAQLLLGLIKQHSLEPMASDSWQFVLLHRLLKRFGSTKGIVSLLPPVGGSLNSKQEQQIKDMMSLLFEVISLEAKKAVDNISSGAGRKKKSSGQTIDNDSNKEFDAEFRNQTAIMIIRSYQTHLVSLVSECSDPSAPPVQILLQYGAIFLTQCTELIEIVLSGPEITTLHADTLMDSIVGKQLPSFLISLTLFGGPIGLVLSEAMMPYILSLNSLLCKLNANYEPCKTALKSLSMYNLGKKMDLVASAKNSGPIKHARFNPSQTSSGISLSDNDKKVTSTTGNSQHSVVNVGFTSGKGHWVFRIDGDNRNDEHACLGAAISPVTESAYNKSSQLWMLRAYNGMPYARGVEKKDNKWTSIHEGDLVRLDLDLNEGTLKYTINGAESRVIFTDLPKDKEIFPAIATYGSGVKISLVEVVAETPVPYMSSSYTSINFYQNYVLSFDETVLKKNCPSIDSSQSAVQSISIAKSVKLPYASDLSKNSACVLRSSAPLSKNVHSWKLSFTVGIKIQNFSFGITELDCVLKHHVGTDLLSWGVLNGCLWANGIQGPTFPHPPKLASFEKGTEIFIKLDVSSKTLSMCLDSRNKIVLFGPIGSEALMELDSKVIFGSSPLYPTVGFINEADVHFSIAPCGLNSFIDNNSTLELPWLIDLEQTLAFTSGFMASSLVTGSAVSSEELEIQPWLQSSLFTGGVKVREEEAILSSVPALPQGSSGSLEDCTLLIPWLEKSLGEAKWKVRQKFPIVESSILRACLYHTDLWADATEAIAILRSDKSNFESLSPPSESLKRVWKYVNEVRKYLNSRKTQLLVEEENKVNSESDLKESKEEEDTISGVVNVAFNDLLANYIDRAEFLMSVSPNTGDSLPPKGFIQLVGDLSREHSKADGSASNWTDVDNTSEKWQGFVNVLKAAAVSMPSSVDDGDSNPWGKTDKSHEIDEKLKTIVFYIKGGISPKKISDIVSTRCKRARERIFGLDSVSKLLKCYTSKTSMLYALVSLKPAFKAHLSKEAVSSNYHYLNNLSGCTPVVLENVQGEFIKVYLALCKIMKDCITSDWDADMIHALFSLWGINYESRDHEFLVNSEFLDVLIKVLDVDAWNSVALRQIEIYKDLQARKATAVTWRPWSFDSVLKGFQAGSLSKIALLSHMRSVPSQYKLIDSKWWETHKLQGDNFVQIVKGHSIQSLLLAFQNFLLSIGQSLTVIKDTAPAVESKPDLLKDGARVSQFREIRKNAWSLFKFIITGCIDQTQILTRGRLKSDSFDESLLLLNSPPILASQKSAFGTDHAHTMYNTLSLEEKAFGFIEKLLVSGLEILCPSSFKGFSNILESHQAEAWIFDLMTFIYSICEARTVRVYILKPEFLASITKLLSFGSPRIKRIVILILTVLAPSFANSDILDVALAESLGQNSIVKYLLSTIGQSLIATSYENPIFKESNTVHLNDSPYKHKGSGSGYVCRSLAVECTLLLHAMAACSKTHHSEIVSCVTEGILSSFEALKKIKTGIMIDVEVIIHKIAASFFVLSPNEILRIGAKVRVNQDKVIGTIVSYSPGQTSAAIVIGDGNTAEEGNLVSVDSITPIIVPFGGNAVNTILKSVKLNDKIASCFVDICQSLIEIETREPTLASFWVSSLVSLGSQALYSMMKEMKSLNDSSLSNEKFKELLNVLINVGITPRKEASFLSIKQAEEMKGFLHDIIHENLHQTGVLGTEDCEILKGPWLPLPPLSESVKSKSRSSFETLETMTSSVSYTCWPDKVSLVRNGEISFSNSTVLSSGSESSGSNAISASEATKISELANLGLGSSISNENENKTSNGGVPLSTELAGATLCKISDSSLFSMGHRVVGIIICKTCKYLEFPGCSKAHESSVLLSLKEGNTRELKCALCPTSTSTSPPWKSGCRVTSCLKPTDKFLYSISPASALALFNSFTKSKTIKIDDTPINISVIKCTGCNALGFPVLPKTGDLCVYTDEHPFGAAGNTINTFSSNFFHVPGCSAHKYESFKAGLTPKEAEYLALNIKQVPTRNNGNLSPPEGLFVCVTTDTGRQVSMPSPCGKALKWYTDDKLSAVIDVFNEETGFTTVQKFDEGNLRVVTNVYGASVKKIKEITKVACNVDGVISRHFIRQAVVSFLSLFYKSGNDSTFPRLLVSDIQILNIIKLIIAERWGALGWNNENVGFSNSDVFPRSSIGISSNVILDQCLLHFNESIITDPSCKSTNIQMVQIEESEHPFDKSITRSSKHFTIPNSKNLVVTLDANCALPTGMQLCFYSTDPFAVSDGAPKPIFTLSKEIKTITSFVVKNSKKVFIKPVILDSYKASEANNAWGYKFTVKSSQEFEAITVTKFSKVAEIAADSNSSIPITFWRPLCPAGCSSLGDIAIRGLHQPATTTIVVNEISDGAASIFAEPVSFEKLFVIKTLAIWRPIPPAGYVSIGDIVGVDSEEPATELVKCVRKEFSEPTSVGARVWDNVGALYNGDHSLWNANNSFHTFVAGTGIDSPFVVFNIINFNKIDSRQWQSEEMVLSSPSIDWASWLLEGLLNDSSVDISPLAGINLFTCLVRILKCDILDLPKKRIVPLLTNLVKFFWKRRVYIDCTTFLPVMKLVLDKCTPSKKKADGSFVVLPKHLLHLVELTSIVDHMQKMGALVTPSRYILNEKKWDPMSPFGQFEISNPSPDAKLSNDDLASDAINLIDALAYEARLPDALVCRIWLESLGNCVYVQSKHPLSIGDLGDSGSICIEGTKKIFVILDSKCEVLDKGACLRIQSLDKKYEFFGGSNWFSKLPLQEGIISSEGVYQITGDSLKWEWITEASFSKGGWGYSFAACGENIPWETNLLKLSKTGTEEFSTLVNLNAGWTKEMDLMLVKWINKHIAGLDGGDEKKHQDILLAMKPYDVRLTDFELRYEYQLLSTVSLKSLHIRVAVILVLNKRLLQVIHLFDVNPTKNIFKVRGLILNAVKGPLLKSALQLTISSKSKAHITLDNTLASKSSEMKETDILSSKNIFCQAFKELSRDSEFARVGNFTDNHCFNVSFVGEDGSDGGGVFREAMARIIEELFSTNFNLLVLSPNGQNNMHLNKDTFLPNPKHNSVFAGKMFEFVGQLMGMSLRCNLMLPFRFPEFIYASILGEPVPSNWEEISTSLNYIDSLTVQFLTTIKNSTSDVFESFDLKWKTIDSNGIEIELIPGGFDIPVKWEERFEYSHKVAEQRLTEFDFGIKSIAKGLFATVPERVLCLFLPSDLEQSICGTKEIDINYLKENTKYTGYTVDSPAIKMFWNVMESITNEERSLFIRFAWGKSRLPSKKYFTTKFHISVAPGGDSVLPKSHTCFFNVELPTYTTEEIMRRNILICVHFGCSGILMT